MAGRPIRRPAKLALVTTSSLYEAYGSSQYNRLKVETEKGALAYRKVARTESFGTVQFAPGHRPRAQRGGAPFGLEPP